MKTVTSEDPVHKDVIHKLPALYQATDSSMIVLFTGLEVGTVMANPAPSYYIGKECYDWLSCDDEEEWTRLSSCFEITHIQE